MSTVIQAEVKTTPKGEQNLDWEAKVGVQNSGIKAGPFVPHWGL